jgi:hypothetical protein
VYTSRDTFSRNPQTIAKYLLFLENIRVIPYKLNPINGIERIRYGLSRFGVGL